MPLANFPRLSLLPSDVLLANGARLLTVITLDVHFFTDHDDSTYGHGFNMNGGGVYARIWDEQLIKV